MISVTDQLVSKALRVTAIKKKTTKLNLPDLDQFTKHIARTLQISIETQQIALLYLNRLSEYLPETSTGVECTPYRVLLSSLILAHKTTNDKSIRNSFWARATIMNKFKGFALHDVNLMERQFLGLIEYNLNISQQDYYSLVCNTGNHCNTLDEAKLSLDNSLKNATPLVLNGFHSDSSSDIGSMQSSTESLGPSSPLPPPLHSKDSDVEL